MREQVSANRQESTVQFVDLGRLHASMGEELELALRRVVEQGGFTLGAEVDGFERAFAAYVGASHAVGVGSGTDALHLALKACGIGPGDEVITAVNTFAATAEAILMVGARPVFVDVDEQTQLMDLDAVASSISERTRAIIPVHLYGQTVDMDRLMALAARAGVRVIEDACQAHGAWSDSKRAGSIGDAGCFSFYPSKNLGALGDGGMVTTNDPELAARVASLRNHGEDSSRLHVEPGYCSRLHGLQAAFLSVKLPHLDEWNGRRAEAAITYQQLLKDLPVVLPVQRERATHVYHLYVVRVEQRDRVRALLAERGIQTGIHYAVPLHMEPAFSGFGYSTGEFPAAERAAETMISLPMHPYIEQGEIERVCRAVEEAVVRE